MQEDLVSGIVTLWFQSKSYKGKKITRVSMVSMGIVYGRYNGRQQDQHGIMDMLVDIILQI